MARTAITMGLALVALGGCATNAATELPATAAPATAAADLRDASGRSWARASAGQVGDSVRIAIDASGMAPGAYAVHVTHHRPMHAARLHERGSTLESD